MSDERMSGTFKPLMPTEPSATRCPRTCKWRGPHHHCKGCGFIIAPTEKWCGECACEEDTLD